MEAAGLFPDKVVFMQAARAEVKQRAKLRRATPANPTAPNAGVFAPDTGVARHDDTDENIAARLDLWDQHER